MGALEVVGAGGGKPQEPRKPHEAPDSLQSVATARILMLVGLGEMGGLVNGDQSVFFSGVPLQNPDGSHNFERVRVEHRTGGGAQAPIPGFDEVETEFPVGVEVKGGAGIVRSIDDPEATAVRVTVSVRGLMEMTEEGDTNPSTVEMLVDLRKPGGAWRLGRNITIQGKTRSKYQRAVRIELPEPGPWEVRVRRLSGDSTTQRLINATEWDSFTVIQSLQLSYPGYALLGVTFDAKQFSSVPEITSDWNLSTIRIPSNYDAEAGTYAGAWDGTFRRAVSSNPAWCLFALATDERFNINLPPDGAWKWDLYRIGQWCDQRVNDGMGGQRRRFELHDYHSAGGDAWKVLQDMASVFCGRVVPSAGGIRVVADMPGDVPAKHFVPANVIDGRFSYTSTEQAERYSVASVSFVDPADSWKRAIEYVEHADGLARYGYQPAEVVAVGCTNRAQAQQLGRYILETSQTETELISFAAGLYGCDLLPGELFTVFDPVFAGRNMAGRLLAVDGVSVQLDAPVTLDEGVAYSLECPMPDGTLAQRGVVVTPGETDRLQLVAPFPAQPVAGATWALSGTNLQPTIWRCVSRREREPGIYEISGLQHNPHKWETVERGICIDAPPVSNLPDPAQIPPVAAVAMREVPYLTGDGRREVRLEVDWPAVSHPYLRGYVVGYREEGGNWRELPELSANHAELSGLVPGVWQVRVSSVSATGLRSIPALAQLETRGHVAPPARPALSATGGAMVVNLSWRYPAGVPDLVRAELFYSVTPNDGNPVRLADVAYPTNTFAHYGVGAGVRYYYWLRVVDSWGNPSAFAQADAEAVRDPSLLLQQLQGSISGGMLVDELRQPLERVSSLTVDIDGAAALAESAIDAAMQNVLTNDLLGDTQARHRALAKQELKTTSEALRQEASARLTLAARMDDTQAGLSQEQIARVEADRALASDVKTLASKTAGDLAGVRQELQAATGPDGALAKRLDQLTAQQGDGQKAMQAGLQQEQTARADADKALAGDIKTLTSKTAGDLATVRQELQTATGPGGALAKRLDQLTAQQGDGQKAMQAGLQQEQTARADADKALAGDIKTLTSKTAGDLATVRQELQTATGPDGTLAKRLDTLTSRVGDSETTISQQAKTVNGLMGQWSVQITRSKGGKDFVSGFALNNGERGSEFAVLADKFLIAQPNGDGAAQVFTVGKLNGRVAAGLSGDMILDGTLIGNRVIAKESIQAEQIDGRRLRLLDNAGNVVVDMDGMGAHKIKGKLKAEQIDATGLMIPGRDGRPMIDLDGVRGGYIRDLVVDTASIAGNAVTASAFVNGSSIAVNVPAGASVYVTALIVANNNANGDEIGGLVWVRLRRNGAVISSCRGNASCSYVGFGRRFFSGGSTVLAYADTPGEGTHTYSIDADWPYSVGASATVSVLILKR
ncbi:DUF1983 domain-containing protein [Chromobacterium violaceum]|uniref:TipJ family phage tail tip protein n=1 Tax=Chromobacterium violaceum TaxID=536 RepID=UPI001B333D49|nr:DUF1983 domain-containing protein [Chromobacterium violaceum]